MTSESPEPPRKGVTRIVFDDTAELARGAAELVATALSHATSGRGTASFVLAGGTTPAASYRALARKSVDWGSVDLFWGDERCVPPDHPASNYRMASTTLLEPAKVPAERVHRIPGELPTDRAVREYETLLRQRFDEPWPRFDLVLLGMGVDGHVASLFPGHRSQDDRPWVIPVEGGPGGIDRVSLSMGVLTAAEQLVLLVSGAAKADTVKRALTGTDPGLPAAVATAHARKVTWLLDRPAASGLL